VLRPQLGRQIVDGTTSDQLAPVDVAGLAAGVAAIAAGSRRTCALLTTGGVRCLGLNDCGQLGDGSNAARSSPTPVSDLATVIELSAALFTPAPGKRTSSVHCFA
jgi:alpha-tubulin suppressor-like RCC1 family protein